MDKALNYVALARKGGMIELGEEPVGAITRTGKGYLVIVASDASDHTWRRAKSFVAGTEQQCVRLPFTKEEFGFSVGRSSLAIAAFTDAALALAFVKALPNPEKYAKETEVLEEKNAKLRQRQKEAKAHQRNVRMGKKK
ncbi:MAG: 50S ribosomal protein L7 [Oscillospiraceae bacterium]|nr:50S ribosomal protein L7 [Oscillospiraceae bacterium]